MMKSSMVPAALLAPRNIRQLPVPKDPYTRLLHISRVISRKKRLLAEKWVLHPDLSLTEMYNVLSKLRANVPLTAQEHRVYETGLISVLKQTHDELDETVCEAYGCRL